MHIQYYDPAGYAFIGEFSTMSGFGSLTFQYRDMLPKDPPRPDLHPRQRPVPLIDTGSYHN